MGKLRPEREGIRPQPQSRAEHIARPQLLARSPRLACLCFSPGGSQNEWAVLLGPPPTSAAGQLGATCQACREVPSQGAKLCRADSGSLAPSKESEHGKREAVESEKPQLVRAGEAGASRSGIAQSVAGRGVSFLPSAAAPRGPWPGVSPGPPPCSHPGLGPACPACPGRPPLSVWKEEAGPCTPAAGLGGTRPAHRPPAAGGQRLRASQDTWLGRPAPVLRCPRGPLQGTVIPSLAAQLFSQRDRDMGPGAS